MSIPKKVFVSENNDYTQIKADISDIKLQMENITMSQNELSKKQEEMVKMMAEMKVLFTRSLGITRGSCKPIFPLKTTAELEEVNFKLNETEFFNDIMFQVRHLIRGDIKNNLQSIFSDSLIMEINYDGKGNKRALKSFDKFMEILCGDTDVIPKETTITALRNALKMAKGRIHKQTSRNAKK